MGKKKVSVSRLNVMVRDLQKMQQILTPSKTGGDVEMRGMDDYQRTKRTLNTLLHTVHQVSILSSSFLNSN